MENMSLFYKQTVIKFEKWLLVKLSQHLFNKTATEQINDTSDNKW